MKYKFFNLLLIAVISFSTVTAQSSIQNRLVDETVQSQDGYPVDARPLLERLSKAAGIDLDKIEPVPPQLRKTNWNFNVGSTYQWWAHDLSGTSITFYQTPTTCRAIGNNCYIFVEDSMWTSGRVDQIAVNRVLEAFDTKNALPNSTKGIYQTNVESFGNPPNVDNDPRIIILILNIKDGYTPGNAYTAGYFYSYNQGTGSNSNKAEVFYLDANPLNLKTDNGIYTGMSITAHEFQHMIHWNYVSSTTFYNEAFSEIASYLNGYSLRTTTRFANETNQYLLIWRDGNDVLKDYERAARYALYLSEQFTPQIFRQYLQTKIKDASGITLAAQVLDPTGNRNFETILEDWFIANYLNDRNYNTRYGYQLSGQPQGIGITHNNPNVPNTSRGVSKYGVQYISYKAGKNLSVNFNNLGNSSIKVKAIKIGNGVKEVVNVPTNTDVGFSDFGTTYNEITFAVYITDQNLFMPSAESQFNFIYSSTGTEENFVTELKYDEADTKAALGAFGLSVNDTIAVLFNGMSGTKLQKIKVGLRNTNQITGRIYRTTGVTTRPLGQPISQEFTLTGNSAPISPFPVPWPNMVEFDLSSQNIDAGQNFAVVFFYKGISGNNIVVVAHSPVEYYYSLTYLNSPSSNSPGWYYLKSSDTEVGLYVIRALVGTGPVSVADGMEIMPANYALEQNYPNPFNPETVISFSLPKSSNVQIKIYDVLGKEIRTLISEERNAGKHNIYWNATDDYGKRVSSGVYFYTIITDNFSQTKKMVLMK
jgi:hypothetical protein